MFDTILYIIILFIPVFYYYNSVFFMTSSNISFLNWYRNDKSIASSIPSWSISDMWFWEDEKLEAKHDYIQYVFPLNEASPYNGKAPVLNNEEIKSIQSDNELKFNMLKSLNRMLKFYGFQEIDIENYFTSGYQAKTFPKTDNYKEQLKNWGTGFNHNHLRMTRIIRSLHIFGLSDLAVVKYNTLLECVNENPKIVNANSLKYWEEARDYRPL